MSKWICVLFFSFVMVVNGCKQSIPTEFPLNNNSLEINVEMGDTKNRDYEVEKILIELNGDFAYLYEWKKGMNEKIFLDMEEGNYQIKLTYFVKNKDKKINTVVEAADFKYDLSQINKINLYPGAADSIEFDIRQKRLPEKKKKIRRKRFFGKEIAYL